jgi:hypothetical protein
MAATNEAVGINPEIHIDLTKPFGWYDLTCKASLNEYHYDAEFINDLLKVFVEINGKELYIIKDFNARDGVYVASFKNRDSIHKLLTDLRLWSETSEYSRPKVITGWDVFQKYKYFFNYEDIVFNSDNKRLFGIFHGWHWNELDDVNMDVLNLWFKHVKEVICNDDPVKYEYINKWIAYIVQNATRSTVGLVLQGIQGAGKNAFSDVLAQLFRGFSNGDITDMDDLTGNNSGIENKVFIALNEARNAGEDRFANFDKLKAYIVAPSIDISEKYVKKHSTENVLNIVFTTNNDYPIKIEKGDRRYYVLMVSGRYKHDKQYFNDYYKACNGDDFFNNLMTYYMYHSTSFTEVRDPPMTEEKEAVIDASRSPIDLFIAQHYDELLEGWKCDECRDAKPYEIKDRQFNLAMAGKCIRKQRRDGNRKPYYYQLKSEWIEYYKGKSEDSEVSVGEPAQSASADGGI